MNQLLALAFSIPGIIVATTLHEFTRAAVSTALGDTLPKNRGRLTLNPVKSFEPIGFLIMLATGFGWGRPVHTSAIYYKDRKKGILLTAILPSVVNLAIAPVFLYLSNNVAVYNIYLAFLFSSMYKYNLTLAVYNLAPMAPMDCVKVLSVVLPANKYYKFVQYEKMIQMICLLLLFMGITNIVFYPIINALDGLFNLIV